MSARRVAVARAALAGVRVAERAARALGHLASEVALSRLDDDDRRALTIGSYARAARFAPASPFVAAGLYAWEEEAIARFFPAAPASLVVGGAGAGREALALARRGYAIALAWDPVVAHAEALRVALGGAPHGEVWTATHEELPHRARSLGPIGDAAVLGWSSYAHVVGGAARVALLAELRRLVRGPLLVSFVGPPASPDRPAERARGALRRVLARLPGAFPAEPGDRLEPWGALVHHTTRDEVDAEASRAGWRVVAWADLETTLFPHAVLVPRG